MNAKSARLGKGRRTAGKSALVNDRGNWPWWREKGKKTSKPTERGEGETSQRHHLCFIVVFFILAQRKLSSGENEGFLCYCFFSLPLPPKWTVLFLGFFPLSWVGWGFLTIPWLCLFHHFFHIIPLWAPFLFFLLLVSSVVEVDQVTHQQWGSQFHLRLLSLLSCLMLKNFHTGELCQIA